MKTFLLCFMALTLSLAAETQADRDLFDGLLRSAAELDARATKIRNSNPVMSDDEAVNRVMAEVHAPRESGETRLQSPVFAASNTSESWTAHEITIAGTILLATVLAFVVVWKLVRRFESHGR
jgi:hypothetical protein